MKKERKEYEQKYLSLFKFEFIQTGNTKTKTKHEEKTQAVRVKKLYKPGKTFTV